MGNDNEIDDNDTCVRLSPSVKLLLEGAQSNQPPTTDSKAGGREPMAGSTTPESRPVCELRDHARHGTTAAANFLFFLYKN